MNGLIATSAAVVAAIGGPLFGMFARETKPPQPFDEDVTLAGKVPPSVKSLSGAWQFNYRLGDAKLEGGSNNLLVVITLMLKEDGTYHLSYLARWNLPRGVVPLPIRMDGINVAENGKYSLSGEVLLLEPDGTMFANIEDNMAKPAQSIANENHTWIVRLDKAHLAVAGRCASYQVDPVCRETPLIWYSMNAQIGTRWLGREPQ
jgi:hypothetical protein